MIIKEKEEYKRNLKEISEVMPKGEDIIDTNGCTVGQKSATREDFAIAYVADVLYKILDAIEVAECNNRKPHWIPENSRAKSFIFICSECGRIAYDMPMTRSNTKKVCRLQYCPHCGTKMEMDEVAE